MLWRHLQATTRVLTVLAAAEAFALCVIAVTFPGFEDGAPERIGSQFVLNNHGTIHVVSEATYWRATNAGWGVGAAFIGAGFFLFVVGFVGLSAARRNGPNA